jgi:hypothetical protein
MTHIGAPIEIVRVAEPRPDELPLVRPSRQREEEQPIPAPDWPRKAPVEQPAEAPHEAR